MIHTTFKSRSHLMAVAAFERLAIFIETLPDRLLEVLYTWQKRHTERRHLSQLSDRFLIDMGLDRADTLREVSKPFWKG